MARLKRSSKDLEKASKRAAALASIDPQLDLGSGLTLTAYQAKIDDTASKLTTYNKLLSATDEAYNALIAGEREVLTFSDRVLNGVAAKYGKDSSQYEQAGGTRTSERARPKRGSSGNSVAGFR